MDILWPILLGLLTVLLAVAFGRRLIQLRHDVKTPLRERHADEPHCESCGYPLIGLDVPRCPECGTLRGFRVPLDTLGIAEEELRTGFARRRRTESDSNAAEDQHPSDSEDSTPPPE